MADFPIIVLGTGGHAKVVINSLKTSGAQILGITDLNPKTHGETRLGVPVLGDDDHITEHPADTVQLVNGLGSTGKTTIRRKAFERLKEKGYEFLTVIHPSAIIAEDVTLGEGAQVMAGVVIQPGVRIGHNVIVNTRASVDHDCVIGDHVHIAPGATLSGGIQVGKTVHVGAGATIVQNIKIGDGCFIAAGAVVVGDIPDGENFGTCQQEDS